MSDLLESLLDQRVEVRSGGEEHARRDEGQLVVFDDRWTQLQTTPGETLFFFIANVRLVKQLK